ncbi:Sec-independent protein translocase protein TatB [Methylobacterium oryzihabitans]|uniref:Sec-independent protein translocase protein TatB n=1 Tax=Methylobacterium oryzihabitans TaxID=2499852 RepID=A0A437P1C4_9HYPH|nr:Sec-independent protein translocase protein TatB [Methylobacterium oryzihabitans]RVU16020.1 twin-arginine translocase subunit TatB [Methylobacterium oryzihabitans]
MFDMSWGELMLIGGVALVVIGPKDLPKALRTVGQVTSKLKRMAGEFHAQFNEAMREAELDEVRREVGEINRTVSSGMSGFNPVQTIRNELKGAVDGISASPSYDPPPPALPAVDPVPAPGIPEAAAETLAPAAEPAAEPVKPSADTLAAATARLRAAARAAAPAQTTTGETP